jgi:hypothetical protein
MHCEAAIGSANQRVTVEATSVRSTNLPAHRQQIHDDQRTGTPVSANRDIGSNGGG